MPLNKTGPVVKCEQALNFNCILFFYTDAPGKVSSSPPAPGISTPPLD